MRSWLLVAVSVLIVPAVALAQHHGGMASGPRVVAAPRASFASVPRAATRLMSTGSARVVTRSSGMRTAGVRTRRGTSVASGPLPEFGTTGFEGVPGLGFDFPHLAAVSGNRRHNGRFGNSFPFGFGGFLFDSPSVIVEQAPPAEGAAPAAEDAIAGNVAESDGPRRSRESRVYGPSAEAAAQTNPQADVEEYVFVQRNGGLLFAVAYSWDNGMLRYVTRDGLRRSIASEALDLSATEQFNEQRGLNFHLPA
jgi:hypothetical protein